MNLKSAEIKVNLIKRGSVNLTKLFSRTILRNCSGLLLGNRHSHATQILNEVKLNANRK